MLKTKPNLSKEYILKLCLLISERLHLEEKLDEYKFLSPDEEKQIVELDESVEAIDAAIDYKNDIMRQVIHKLINRQYIYNFYSDLVGEFN